MPAPDFAHLSSKLARRTTNLDTTMPHPSLQRELHDVAFLYLAMAHGTDNFLSDTELQAVTDTLHACCPDLERSAVQDVVMEALAVYMETEHELEAATKAIVRLRKHLSDDERAVVMEDLLEIARADGVVLRNERTLLSTLADYWKMALPEEGQEPTDTLLAAGQGEEVMHHLGFIYLVLAHGTDHDLSAEERRVILKKLREWHPDLDEERVEAVLDAATERYAHGADEAVLQASIRAVKEALPAEQRMAALNDLIRIANADGVFLDDEEDLINDLMNAWELDAYANYGRHGRKE